MLATNITLNINAGGILIKMFPGLKMLATRIKLNINARSIHKTAQQLIRMFPVLYSNSPEFGYSNVKQKTWAKLYPGWSRQYPIIIYSGTVEMIGMAPLQMEGYDKTVPGRLAIGNNGHTVSISLVQDNKNHQCNSCRPPTISGGLLKNVYEFEGLHFHWTKKNNRGCEHVIDNIRYPLEMHIVHRNIKYDCIEKALEHEDGLCVAAVFFDITEMPYKAFNTIVDNFIYIQNTKTNITLDCGLVLDTLLPGNTQSFYTYKGSLLSPPYNKSINWIIFAQPIYISFDQLSAFQLLQKNQDNEIFDNCRNIQPIEEKKVYARDPNIPFIPACDVPCPNNIPITTNSDVSCPHVPNATYNEMYFPISPNESHEINKKILSNNSTSSTNNELLDSNITKKQTPSYNDMYFPISSKNENDSNKKILDTYSTSPKKDEYNGMCFPISSKEENYTDKKLQPNPTETNNEEPTTLSKEEHTANYNEMYFPTSSKDETEPNQKIENNQSANNTEVLTPTLTRKKDVDTSTSAVKKEFLNPIATNVLSSKSQDRGLMASIRNLVKDALIKFFSK